MMTNRKSYLQAGLISILIMKGLLFCSCTHEYIDCLCSQEFRSITIFVTDVSNDPVTGLDVSIKDEQGKIYTFPQEPPFMPGIYIIMTDNNLFDFSIYPKKIIFEGTKDSLFVRAEFFINTDKCKCHINKVNGPDTLILR